MPFTHIPLNSQISAFVSTTVLSLYDDLFRRHRNTNDNSGFFIPFILAQFYDILLIKE